MRRVDHRIVCSANSNGASAFEPSPSGLAKQRPLRGVGAVGTVGGIDDEASRIPDIGDAFSITRKTVAGAGVAGLIQHLRKPQRFSP